MEGGRVNILHVFVKKQKDTLEESYSEESDILRFLVRCFPQGVTALNYRGDAPYALLNPINDYGRRFLLMQAHKLDPSSLHVKYRKELRRLNYEERKLALFAFFSSASEMNIFTRIRWAADGDSLMRVIVGFL